MRVGLLLISVVLLTCASTRADRIHDLVREGNLKEVQKLLAATPEMTKLRDSMGRTPLHIAASSGRREIATLLLNRGADIDSGVTNQFSEGETPLITAVSSGHTEIALFLIGKGANVAPTCRILMRKGGHTALHVAAERRNTKVIKALLDKEADPNVQDESGETPLFGAVRAASPDPENAEEATLSVKLLLNAKADPNKATKTGLTPLHQAARAKHFGACMALVNASANVNAVDEKKITPLKLAMKSGDPRIIKLLKDKGAVEEPQE